MKRIILKFIPEIFVGIMALALGINMYLYYKTQKKIDYEHMLRVGLIKDEILQRQLKNAFMEGENKQIERCNKILESLR